MNNFFPKTTIVNISNRNRQCFGRTKRQFFSVYYICPKNDNFLHPKLGIRPKTTFDNKKLKWQKPSFKAFPRMSLSIGKGNPPPPDQCWPTSKQLRHPRLTQTTTFFAGFRSSANPGFRSSAKAGFRSCAKSGFRSSANGCWKAGKSKKPAAP